MDSYLGGSSDPASLHKYAFNHSDPVNRIDPSGNVSLLSLTVNVTLINTAVNVAFWAGAYATGGTSVLATAIAEDVAFMLIPGGAYANAAKRIGQIFAKARKFKIGYGHSPTTLGHNLEVFGFSRLAGDRAHHIVPGGEKFASAVGARQILDAHKIDINSPLNGAFVDKVVHRGRHAERYSDAIFVRLKAADTHGGADAVRAELQLIQQEIRHSLWDNLL